MCSLEHVPEIVQNDSLPPQLQQIDIIKDVTLLPLTFYAREKKPRAVKQLCSSLVEVSVLSTSFITVWRYVQ